jgi:AraC-like DNA-binding protein
MGCSRIHVAPPLNLSDADAYTGLVIPHEHWLQPTRTWPSTPVADREVHGRYHYALQLASQHFSWLGPCSGIDTGGEAAAVDGSGRRRWAVSGGRASTASAPPGAALWDPDRVTLEDLVRLRRARDLMDRDYAKPLDVPALARSALMSQGHFSRSFRAAFGETPYSYLMTRRIERAKALLRRGDLTVTDVCFAVGCTSLGSFSSRFTELVGESPSSYRARRHDEGAAIPACVAKIHTRPVRSGEVKPAPRPVP